MRAQSLCQLFYDGRKYAEPKKTDVPVKYKDAEEIIKNGWANLGKAVDFSSINVDFLLRKACRKGWSSDGVRTLVEDFKANLEGSFTGSTPLIYACNYGHDDIAKLLIKLGSNIEHKTDINNTRLALAVKNGHEGCVRILLSERASTGVKNTHGKTALDL